MASQAAARGTDYKAAIEDITAQGVAAIQNTRERVEDAVETARERGQEAIDGARDARDGLERFVKRSIKQRPYTTLLVAGMIGFAYAVLRR